MNVSLELKKPMGFGILTTLNEAQAYARSQPCSQNKGLEAARACYQSCMTLV
jgi:6,7-dimethyl-8-ribityllumazine synthase